MSSKGESTIVDQIRGHCDFVQKHLSDLDGQECRTLPHVITGHLDKEELKTWISCIRNKCSDGPKNNPTFHKLLQVLQGWPASLDLDRVVLMAVDPLSNNLDRARMAQLLRDRLSWLFKYDKPEELIPVADGWDLPVDHPDKTTQDGIPFWVEGIPNKLVYTSKFPTNIDLWEKLVLGIYIDEELAELEEKKTERAQLRTGIKEDTEMKELQEEQRLETEKRVEAEITELQKYVATEEKLTKEQEEKRTEFLKKKIGFEEEPE